jgi:hypothetical protein
MTYLQKKDYQTESLDGARFLALSEYTVVDMTDPTYSGVLLRNEQKNGRVRFPSFNISDNPEFETVVNLLDYVGDRYYTTCGDVAGVARQQGYPGPCVLRFPTIYTGRQSWDDPCADLNKNKAFNSQFTNQNTRLKPLYGHCVAHAIKCLKTTIG